MKILSLPDMVKKFNIFLFLVASSNNIGIRIDKQTDIGIIRKWEKYSKGFLQNVCNLIRKMDSEGVILGASCPTSPDHALVC